MTRARPADVAIYAPLAGSLYLAGDRPSGGAELQSFHLARALVAAGVRVRHVVAGTDLDAPQDGVEIVPLPNAYGSGSRLARRLAILAALRAANASLYIQRSAGFETGVVGAFAKTARRSFVFSSSSDADFDLDAITSRDAGASLDRRPTRLQYRWGLRLADEIVVQTYAQQVLAQDRLALQTRVIRSFCSPDAPVDRPGEAFLWIGGLVAFKDPLAYVRLAAAVPEAMFWMIGTDRGPIWNELAAAVRGAAKKVPNLEILAPHGRAELLELYNRAVAVVSTSRFEGFPNVFLEAWARGRPVLSLAVDPDGIVEQFGLGVVGDGSLLTLAAAARKLWHGREDYAAMSSVTRQYVRDFHDPAVVGRQWVGLVRELL